MFLGNFLGNKKVNRFKTILVFMHLMLFLPKKKKTTPHCCVSACMCVCLIDCLNGVSIFQERRDDGCVYVCAHVIHGNRNTKWKVTI